MVKVIENSDGTRTFQLEKAPEPAPKKVTKAALKREREAVVGKGLSKTRRKYTKPSAPIVTNFD